MSTMAFGVFSSSSSSSIFSTSTTTPALGPFGSVFGSTSPSPFSTTTSSNPINSNASNTFSAFAPGAFGSVSPFSNPVPAFGTSSCSSTLSTVSEPQPQEPQQLSAKINAGKDIEQKIAAAEEQEGVKVKEEIEPSAGKKEDRKPKEVPPEAEEEQPASSTIEKSDKFMYTRILKGITHNPHFTPLQSYSKRAREKMIAGWDEIFEETIDQMQSLTAATFSANVHELWKTIAELENLGYTVARLNKRLDELMDAMNKRSCSQAEISELKTRAEDYRKEKQEIEREIADLHSQAEKAQVMVDELMDQVSKMESNLPVVDALFENLAKNPL